MGCSYITLQYCTVITYYYILLTPTLVLVAPLFTCASCTLRYLYPEGYCKSSTVTVRRVSNVTVLYQSVLLAVYKYYTVPKAILSTVLFESPQHLSYPLSTKRLSTFTHGIVYRSNVVPWYNNYYTVHYCTPLPSTSTLHWQHIARL